ncbi:MAG: hypothetical protein ACRCXT_00660 [Paraclostridium sp.]
MKIIVYPTKESQELNKKEIQDKLLEECVELIVAIENNTNIEEEVFDVIQMAINIHNKYREKTDISKSNVNHIIKLKKRGLNNVNIL